MHPLDQNGNSLSHGGHEANEEAQRLAAELRSANNYTAVIMIVNGAVNERLETDGGTRGEIPLERLEEVLDQIDQIGDAVQAEIQERLSRR